MPVGSEEKDVGVTGNPIALTITWSFALFPDAQVPAGPRTGLATGASQRSGSWSDGGAACLAPLKLRVKPLKVLEVLARGYGKASDQLCAQE